MDFRSLSKTLLYKYKIKNQKTVELFNETKTLKKHANNINECNMFNKVEGFKHIEKRGDYKWKASPFFTCKNRFCQVCQVKKNLKLQTMLLEKILENKNKYSFFMLTLTIKNCSIEDLNKTLKLMSKAFNTVFTYLKREYDLKGYFRRLEITYKRLENGEISCHPHYHVLIPLKKRVNQHVKLNRFIDFKSLWEKALGVDYNVQVDFRKFDDNGLKELIKYVNKVESKKKEDETIELAELLNPIEMELLYSELKGIRDEAKAGIFRYNEKDLKDAMSSMSEDQFINYIKFIEMNTISSVKDNELKYYDFKVNDNFNEDDKNILLKLHDIDLKDVKYVNFKSDYYEYDEDIE